MKALPSLNLTLLVKGDSEPLVIPKKPEDTPRPVCYALQYLNPKSM